ncbi:alpha/beta fold hydrolase [Desertihabitans aurantiacus]|uniref:alpha/beta fold hydrolase n=1 Tax=Desertihabitans aurantiacus TaxID=2282477 RepID=UPI0018E525D8|nr:alpha/beta hydrolase [Desertihabitans aurantiacus]
MRSTMIEVEPGTSLHVAVCGHGPDVLVLTGGPGCVQYLEDEEIAPPGYRCWYVEPRGVGRSGGGAHTMEQALADLEAVREHLGVGSWTVLGHSWGCDLAVRYALERPSSVAGVVGVAGHGPHRDRTWSAAYEAGRPAEPAVEVAWSREVHASLSASFDEWIHQPGLWRGLADCPVPMRFVAAGQDIRPSWPLQQLAALVPGGSFTTVADVPHDFWSTNPGVWVETVTDALRSTTAAARPADRIGG